MREFQKSPVSPLNLSVLQYSITDDFNLKENEIRINDTLNNQIEDNYVQYLTTCCTTEIDIFNKSLATDIENQCIIKFKNPLLSTSRCIIEVKINGYSVDTLVDTGADGCYIQEELCHQLHLIISTYECEVLVGNNQRA